MADTFDDLPVVPKAMSDWARQTFCRELFRLIEQGEYSEMLDGVRVVHLHKALEQLCRRAVTKDAKDDDPRLLRATAWLLMSWIDHLGKQAGYDLLPRHIHKR